VAAGYHWYVTLIWFGKLNQTRRVYLAVASQTTLIANTKCSQTSLSRGCVVGPEGGSSFSLTQAFPFPSCLPTTHRAAASPGLSRRLSTITAMSQLEGSPQSCSHYQKSSIGQNLTGDPDMRREVEIEILLYTICGRCRWERSWLLARGTGAMYRKEIAPEKAREGHARGVDRGSMLRQSQRKSNSPQSSMKKRVPAVVCKRLWDLTQPD
jgi:hypothetical protein